MGKLCIMLYVNNFFYYLIVIACPILFTLNATCDDPYAGSDKYSKDKGDYGRLLAAPGTKYALKETDLVYSHIIYAVFALYNLVFEVYVVVKIQNKVHNKEILEFNVWHGVELIFGQIARFDTYLCLCFL
jgi:hypothetical protein